MPEDVYRILYCSRNSMQNELNVQLEEVRKILQSSRRNNAADEITGALLFNAGCFAQVLEGPISSVESTFERIQRDRRHEDVTVLEAGYVASREFPNWSMAFSGTVMKESAAFAEFSSKHEFANLSGAAAEIREMLSTLVIPEDELLPQHQSLHLA